MERRFEESYALHNEKYAKRFGSAFLPPGQSTIKRIVIKDIPIMTQPDGTIVCIPRLPEMGVIATVGLTGTGKCAWKNEKIIVNNEVETVKGVYERFPFEELYVYSLNKETLKVERKKIINMEKAIKPLAKITLSSGEDNYFSPDHKFLVLNKDLDIVEKEVQQIEAGEYLIKSDKLPEEQTAEYIDLWHLNKYIGYLCGIYLAEGSLIHKSSGVSICNYNKEIKNNIKRICELENINFSVLMDGTGMNIRDSRFFRFINKYFGEYSENKFISKNIISCANKDFLIGIITGYFDGDGCINKTDFGWVTKSERLAQGINMCLLKLGIANQLKKIRKYYDYKDTKDIREYYYGNITGKEAFKDLIKLWKKSKRYHLSRKKEGSSYEFNLFGIKFHKRSYLFEELIDKYKVIYAISNNQGLDRIPLSKLLGFTPAKTDKLTLVLSRAGVIRREIFGEKFVTGCRNNGKLRLNNYIYFYDGKLTLSPEDFRYKVRRLIDSEIYPCSIKNIEIGELEEMFHIEVEDNHNYMTSNNVLTCNTCLGGRIVDEIFYSWNDYIGVMNDSQEETYSWSEPCDFGTMIFNLRRVGQNPMPLPLIYLFPKFSDFEPDEETMRDKNYVVISIPFEEVINNISKYLPDLGNSEKYVFGIKDEMLGVENAEELFALIDKIDTGTKGMAESKHKIESSFKMLINEGIIDFNKSSHKYLMAIDRKTKEKFVGNPFTAIMKAECIPSFITIDLYNRKYKDSIFSYYINTIFQEMQKEMKGKRVWLYFDELTRVVHTDPQYTSPETERALTNIASRGRNNGISLIYATQRYNEIPKSIRSQTKFAIIFRHKSKEETKMICDDFALQRPLQEQILTLKKMEAIAVTTEYFVCYKRDKCWEEQGPIKGTIIPPLHKNRFGHKEKENDKEKLFEGLENEL